MRKPEDMSGKVCFDPMSLEVKETHS
jgi:hypothetical protein